MKYLQDYQEAKQTSLFNECGTFFAFSMDQFNEQRKQGVKYVNLGAGIMTPSDTAKKLVEGLKKINKEAIAEDIKENGIRGIIRRELFNYEAFYTFSIYDTLDALKDYPIEAKEVQKVFNEILKTEEIAF